MILSRNGLIIFHLLGVFAFYRQKVPHRSGSNFGNCFTKELTANLIWAAALIRGKSATRPNVLHNVKKVFATPTILVNHTNLLICGG
jgi:hypothetical protein